MKTAFPAFALALAPAFALAAFTALAADESDVEPAQAAAMLWLGTVDSGAFGYAWDDSAEFFQRSVTRAEWEKAAGASRKPLGTVKERKLRSAKPTRKLPGVPDADYVVIYYDTQFEKRPSSVEIITPVKEKDGSWRVAGYYIR